jgi:hypothetical protein
VGDVNHSSAPATHNFSVNEFFVIKIQCIRSNRLPAFPSKSLNAKVFILAKCLRMFPNGPPRQKRHLGMVSRLGYAA